MYSQRGKCVILFWIIPTRNYHQLITNHSIWLHIVLIGSIFLCFCQYTIQSNTIAHQIQPKIPAFETTCLPFVNPKIKEYFGNLCICKTPAWAVAHCLERVSINGETIDCIHVMLLNLVLQLIMRI